MIFYLVGTYFCTNWFYISTVPYYHWSSFNCHRS